MSYRITTWNEDAIVKHAETWRTRRKAAFLCYNHHLYGVLKAFGKLDTEAAHHVMRVAYGHDDLLSVGESRSILVPNTGYRVTITREA